MAVNFFEVSDQDEVGVVMRVKTRAETYAVRCEECLASTGNPHPVLKQRLGWTISSSGTFDEGCLEQLVRFVLKQIQHHWCCTEAELTTLANNELNHFPLVDISFIIPVIKGISPDVVSETGLAPPIHFADKSAILPGTSNKEDLLPKSSDNTEGGSGSSHDLSNTARRRRIGRRLLSKKALRDSDNAGSSQDDVSLYDVLEILSDLHLMDALEMVNELTGDKRQKVQIRVKTALYPIVCSCHGSSFHRRLQLVRCTSRAIYESATGAIRDAFTSVREQFHNDESGLDTDEDDDENEPTTRRGRVRLGLHNLRLLFRIPDLRSLFRSGLYTPRYLETQLHEVLDSLRNSIRRGFQLPSL